MEHDPVNGRLGFSYKEQQIELDEAHYQPTFIAKDIEEIRNNPASRKVLKQFQLFSGVSHVDPSTGQIKLNQSQAQVSIPGYKNVKEQNNLTFEIKDAPEIENNYQVKAGGKRSSISSLTGIINASKLLNKTPKQNGPAKMNNDLITVFKNDAKSNQSPSNLNIPKKLANDNSPKMSQPQMQAISSELEKKFKLVQTPPLKPSRKSALINRQTVPVIKIQRSNSNSFLQNQTDIQSLQSQVMNAGNNNRRDSEHLTVSKNLANIKNFRRESHESNYHQKLSLTSVLTPSFAKNQADTPSGRSDFSFAVKDMFSERSSGGSSQNFSEGRKKNLSRVLNHQRNNTQGYNRNPLAGGNIIRVNSNDKKSRTPSDNSSLYYHQQSSNFSFHQHLTTSKEISLNMRPTDIVDQRINKDHMNQSGFQNFHQSGHSPPKFVRKQAYEYLQSKVVTCTIKALHPNHLYKN